MRLQSLECETRVRDPLLPVFGGGGGALAEHRLEAIQGPEHDGFGSASLTTMHHIQLAPTLALVLIARSVGHPVEGGK